jgi:hypothetical protein
MGCGSTEEKEEFSPGTTNILGDVSKCIQAYNTKLLERIVFFGLCPLYNA